MSYDGSITIGTELDTTGVKKGIKNVEGSFDELKNTLARTIGALGVGKLAKDFVGTGIAFNAEVEKYKIALTGLLGSTEEAEKVLAKIREDAAVTPFDVAGLTQANQLLISAGLSADESRETILALGNAVSATGGGNDELKRMALNLQQVKNLGKASSVDIKQFAMAGIDIYGLLADYLGITKKEAAEMTVTWEDLNGALISASKDGGKFFGAMEMQSHSLNGQWSTLKDNFKEFAGEILQPLSELLTTTILPALNDLITGGENLNNWIQKHSTLLTVLGIALGAVTAGLVAYNIAMNADLIVIGLYVGATNLAATVTGVFGAVLAVVTSPIFLVVAAITALIAIVVLLVTHWDLVKEKTLEIWDKIKEYFGIAVDKIVEFFKSLPERIGYFIGFALGKIIQFGVDAYNWARTKIPEVIDKILEFFRNLPSNLWNTLVNAINTLSDWASSMKSKAEEEAPKIIDKILEFFRQLPAEMKQIGIDIVKGLWDGIKEKTDWLKGQVSSFAKGITNGMKSALGIHSPSRVFRDEVGKNMALGIGVGFEKSIQSVYDKMKTSVDFETQKLSSTLSTTASINKNLTASFEINGNTYLDGKVVGRLIAPSITQNLRTAGVM